MADSIKVSTGLGINGQALAVLALLADREIYFDQDSAGEQNMPVDPALVDVDTRAWYNGRERGICLLVRYHSIKVDETLCIVFGEHRSSDNIFVDCWVSDEVFINPPTWHDMPEETYNRRKYFQCADCGNAAAYIEGLIKDYLTRSMLPLSWVCPACFMEGDSRDELVDGVICPSCGPNADRPEATGRIMVPYAAAPHAGSKDG